jgi:DNA replication initiation complex subunit (GINS family)
MEPTLDITEEDQKLWTRLFQLLDEEKKLVKKLIKAKSEEEKREFSRQLAIPIKESLHLLEEDELNPQ